MNQYLDEQERIRREEERKAEEARRRAEEERLRKENPEAEIKPVEPAPAPAITIPEPPKKIDGITHAEVWTWELEDISKVPMEYLQLDEKKLNGVVRAMKGDASIPGIRVFKTRQIRA